jgi:D-alanyl-D-alanine carboxypeptidase
VQSDGTYGLGLMRYDLSCGTFYGHTGRVSGTVSIALADTDGSRGTVIAFNLANDTDPRLPELAGRLLCG